MRIVVISDTHCYEPEVGQGDLLIHAGDFLSSGGLSEASKAGKWFGQIVKNFKQVVCIAGNHDRTFEKRGKDATQEFFNQFANNISYLCHESIEVDGIQIFGSPYTPEFCNWSFNVHRGPEIRKYWDRIPADTDVLVTHGPPRGILDQAAPHYGTEHFGCDDLREVVQTIKPQIHLFGHIHGGRGMQKIGDTTFVNASMVNEAYQQVYEPFVVEV